MPRGGYPARGVSREGCSRLGGPALSAALPLLSVQILNRVEAVWYGMAGIYIYIHV